MNRLRANSKQIANHLQKANAAFYLMTILSLFPVACFGQVEPLVVPLIAGQHINVGTVSVTNTENEILVTYQTTGDWLINETHLDVELTYNGLNTNKKGNPIPGKFTYKTSHPYPVAQVQFTIENFGWSVDSVLYIAAHAVVTSSQGTETAWGDGLDFPGNNWATYFNYMVQAEQQETPGKLQFSDATYTITEPGRFIRRVDVVVTVTRVDGVTGTISADYGIVPGTATPNSDYIVPSATGTLTFEEGETEKTFVVTILDDSLVEGTETIELVLDSSCCLGEQSAAQIVIDDDDHLN